MTRASYRDEAENQLARAEASEDPEAYRRRWLEDLIHQARVAEEAAGDEEHALALAVESMERRESARRAARRARDEQAAPSPRTRRIRTTAPQRACKSALPRSPRRWHHPCEQPERYARNRDCRRPVGVSGTQARSSPQIDADPGTPRRDHHCRQAQRSRAAGFRCAASGAALAKVVERTSTHASTSPTTNGKRFTPTRSSARSRSGTESAKRSRTGRRRRRGASGKRLFS